MVRGIIAQVRFLAYHRIKPHAPPLVRAPVNSFEFHPCGRTPQVGYLSVSLRHSARRPNTEYPSFTAWTTRVSNPVRSPRFRASASVMSQYSAFAIGVLRNIYAFHRYTTHFQIPRTYSRSTVSMALLRLSRNISPLTYKPAYAPFKPNKSGQRLHPPYYRGCWHGVSRCLFCRYLQPII